MSWQNGTHGAENGTYGANAVNGAVGAYDGHGVHPDPAGHTQSPHVYHPQADAGPTPEYDAYADPAAAHGWQNAYDETAEMPTMSAIDAGVGAGAEAGAPGVAVAVVAGGHRRKKSASSRRGVVVGAVAGAVGVVTVALIVGVSGSDAPSGGGSRGEEERARSTAGSSATPVREPAATESVDPAGAGPSDAAPASAGTVGSAPGGSTSPTPSGTAPATSTSGVTSPTATVNGEAGPGNSAGNPGRGKDGTKGPK